MPKAGKIVRSARKETARGVWLRLSIWISWPSPRRWRPGPPESGRSFLWWKRSGAMCSLISIEVEETFDGQLRQVMRYGENPHQWAAFYTTGENRPGVTTATRLSGSATACRTSSAMACASSSG